MTATLGALVWCIKTSMESEGYGDQEPRLPWRGRVTRTVGASFYVSQIDDQGEPDEDPNATAFCSREELFLTREEAGAAYRLAVAAEIKRLEFALGRWRAILESDPGLES